MFDWKRVDEHMLLCEWAELEMVLRSAAMAGTDLPLEVGETLKAVRDEIERRGIDLFRHVPDPFGVRGIRDLAMGFRR